MATVLTSAIVENAIGSIDTYVSTVTQLNSELEGVINTLTSTNFIGQASDGYREFYTQKIVPAIDDNLIQAGNSLTASLKDMLENIKIQLLDTVDPQLGDYNRNPG